MIKVRCLFGNYCAADIKENKANFFSINEDEILMASNINLMYDHDFYGNGKIKYYREIYLKTLNIKITIFSENENDLYIEKLDKEIVE